ncbi:unnamed protein product [Rotaria sp. Silwood2]|nr:unnamed protein product [Rotaria sp. Silwood2]
MPRAAKSWCVRPCHNILNSIIGKNKFVKIGQNPTYPSGIHRIDAITAAHISRQYSLNTPSTSKQVFEGDKICTSCLRKISKQEFEYDNDEFDAIEAMTVDEVDNIDCDKLVMKNVIVKMITNNPTIMLKIFHLHKNKNTQKTQPKEN